MRNQRPRRKGELDERYLSNEECKSLGILILDSRGTVAQHQRALEAGRMPPPPPPPPGPPPSPPPLVALLSVRQPFSSGPLEPMDCDADDGIKSSYVPRDVRRNSLEETGQPSQDEEIYLLQPEDNPSILEELTGAELEEAIRQRNAGQLDPRVIILKRRAPALPVVPPPQTTSQASTRREKELGKWSIQHRLSFKPGPYLPKPELDSVISLVTQRRQYLHNTAVKIRTMIVETSARISAIDGFAPLTVKELAPEKKFSDASCLHSSRACGFTSGHYAASPPEPRGSSSCRSEKRRDPITPTKTRMTSSDEAINTFDTTTDTTTASRGSVNASDDESDASDQPPDPRQVKGKALALPLRAPRGPKTKWLPPLHHCLVRRHLPPADAMAAASASVKQKVSLAEYKARLVASREKTMTPVTKNVAKVLNAVASHALALRRLMRVEAVVIDESPLSTRSTSPKFSPISAKASDAGSDSITSLEKDTE
ncbi:hypothetical protein BC829DRAFT_445437 [Chytridium lagenaria]|nr:hypothetical protein BC829DRAFT_445437 [Chytridium lagenaria]